MAKQEKMTEEEMRESLPPKLYTQVFCVFFTAPLAHSALVLFWELVQFQVNKYMQWSILKSSPLFDVSICF